jgi:hypothetical protein
VRTAPLTDLFQRKGPFASAVVDASGDAEDAPRRRQLFVENAGRELRRQGAPAEIVEAVEARLDEPVEGVPAPITRAVVANADGVVFDDYAPYRLDRASATWAPLPDVAEWVRAIDSFVRFTVVIADREGADIEEYDAYSPRPTEQAEFRGEKFRIHKVRSGGWAQSHRQRHTEDVWRRNAEEAAEHINKLVLERRPPIVVLAGDTRARVLIQRYLSAEAADRVVEVDTGGGRAEGRAREALEQAVSEVLRAHIVQRRLAGIDALRERLGRGEGVATGVRDVLSAFVLGQVDILLIDPDAAREQVVRLPDFPGLDLGTEADDVRADQALIAAAVRTDADAVVLPSSTLGGVTAAGLLRFDVKPSG